MPPHHSQLPASLDGASTHCPGTNYEKSAPMDCGCPPRQIYDVAVIYLPGADNERMLFCGLCDLRLTDHLLNIFG